MVLPAKSAAVQAEAAPVLASDLRTLEVRRPAKYQFYEAAVLG